MQDVQSTPTIEQKQVRRKKAIDGASKGTSKICHQALQDPIGRREEIPARAPRGSDVMATGNDPGNYEIGRSAGDDGRSVHVRA